MRYIIIYFLCIFSIKTHAQIDSIIHQKSYQSPYFLKAIHKTSGKYFYGNKRLSNVYALEIPFAELNDATVNKHYKKFKTYTTIGQVVQIVPTLFLINIIANRPKYTTISSQKGYWTVLITSELISIGTTIIGNLQVKKAVKAYNQGLAKPFRTSYFELESSENEYGLALKYRF
jgi:hypothetical protein